MNSTTFAVCFTSFQALLVYICIIAWARQASLMVLNKKRKRKLIDSTICFDIGIIFLTLIYYLGNVTTVLGYVEERFPNRYPLYKVESFIINTSGRDKGIDNIIELEFTSLWFAKYNIIFLIIITILMIISFIVRKKLNKINKIIFGYYIFSFLIIAFITFCASPVYIEYIESECV